MKLTNLITKLLLDLSAQESHENVQLLIGDGELLRNNLLKLYRATDNQRSQEKIIQIMAEGGYPWFGKLARANDRKRASVAATSANEDEFLMSEDDFMDLIPANGHFH